MSPGQTWELNSVNLEHCGALLLGRGLQSRNPKPGILKEGVGDTPSVPTPFLTNLPK